MTPGMRMYCGVTPNGRRLSLKGAVAHFFLSFLLPFPSLRNNLFVLFLEYKHLVTTLLSCSVSAAAGHHSCPCPVSAATTRCSSPCPVMSSAAATHRSCSCPVLSSAAATHRSCPCPVSAAAARCSCPSPVSATAARRSCPCPVFGHPLRAVLVLSATGNLPDPVALQNEFHD